MIIDPIRVHEKRIVRNGGDGAFEVEHPMHLG
jgi:hypothetical protein